jgi:hypothetical protein
MGNPLTVFQVKPEMLADTCRLLGGSSQQSEMISISVNETAEDSTQRVG